MFTHDLYAVFSFMYCKLVFKSYILAVPIGRNANGLKDAHLPLENLNLDIRVTS